MKAGHRLTLTYILRYDAADEGIARHMANGMGESPAGGSQVRGAVAVAGHTAAKVGG